MSQREELPREVDARLTELLSQGVDSATAEQLAFLKARMSYLTLEEQITFGLAEAPKAEPLETPAPEEPKKRAKKSA